MTSPPAIDQKGLAAFIAEFVGTFFLVLAICGVVSAGAPHGVTVADLGLVHTFALMVMVYAIGSISGCHVNPPSPSRSPPCASSPGATPASTSPASWRAPSAPGCS